MIEELDFAQASEDDRRGLHEVVAAWAVESTPCSEISMARLRDGTISSTTIGSPPASTTS